MKVVSNVPIVAAERFIYKVNNVNTSYAEMMGLPNNLLDTLYWMPWYNSVDLNTDLILGVEGLQAPTATPTATLSPTATITQTLTATPTLTATQTSTLGAGL